MFGASGHVEGWGVNIDRVWSLQGAKILGAGAHTGPCTSRVLGVVAVDGVLNDCVQPHHK